MLHVESLTELVCDCFMHPPPTFRTHRRIKRTHGLMVHKWRSGYRPVAIHYIIIGWIMSFSKGFVSLQRQSRSISQERPRPHYFLFLTKLRICHGCKTHFTWLTLDNILYKYLLYIILLFIIIYININKYLFINLCVLVFCYE